MRVAILQPSYLPWLGYFEQIQHADLFVFLNDVQYTKSDWRNRNRIKTPHGIAWITVPVRRQGLGQRICETLINYATPWTDRHANLLREHYRKAPHFGAVMEVVGAHLAARPLLLQDLAIGLILDLARFMGIAPNTVRSSSATSRRCSTRRTPSTNATRPGGGAGDGRMAAQPGCSTRMSTGTGSSSSPIWMDPSYSAPHGSRRSA